MLNLDDLLKKKKMTLSIFLQQVEFDSNDIATILGEGTTISLDAIKKICDFFECQPNDFLLISE